MQTAEQEARWTQALRRDVNLAHVLERGWGNISGGRFKLPLHCGGTPETRTAATAAGTEALGQLVRNARLTGGTAGIDFEAAAESGANAYLAAHWEFREQARYALVACSLSGEVATLDRFMLSAPCLLAAHEAGTLAAERVLGLLWDGVIEEDDQGELTYARREDEASGDDSSGDEDYDDATAVDGTDMLDGLSLDDLADD